MLCDAQGPFEKFTIQYVIKHFSEQQQNSGAVAIVIRTVGRILHNLDQPMFYFKEENKEEEKNCGKNELNLQYVYQSYQRLCTRTELRPILNHCIKL